MVTSPLSVSYSMWSARSARSRKVMTTPQSDGKASLSMHAPRSSVKTVPACDWTLLGPVTMETGVPGSGMGSASGYCAAPGASGKAV